ncbi:hypothetical protein L6E12_12695 [Actinokineospora sp. PR83]|uniref:hypothetical protein n=1 Tax=Actinokineospora sp. PR83 TaxID=2884908 RepID=UPI001F200EFA|nr:hypothetical protein [Actinokineospora sp. PR83]MCG8916649.1 hypothetical protein [Actinokineospora sp. PR83]
MPAGVGYRALAVLAVVGAVAMGAFLFELTGRHPAGVLPGLVYLVAAVVLVWTPSGHELADRVALGLVLVVASIVMMGVLFFFGGRNPGSLLSGVVFLLAALVLLVGSEVRPGRGFTPPAVLPVLAVLVAGVITGWAFVTDDADPGALVHGSLLLVAVTVFLAGRRARGPGRFAVGAAVCAVSVGIVYFLAVSGGGVVPVVLGAVFLAALVGSLPAVRSAEPTGPDPAVR